MDTKTQTDPYLIDTVPGSDFSGRLELLDRFFPNGGIPVARPVEIPQAARDEIFPGTVNAYGYRGDEFSDSGDFNIAYFGCSWVEGWGVPRGDIFTDQTSLLLRQKTGKKITSYNFGLSAAGIDHTARLLPLALRHLKIDLVVLVVSGLERREMFAPSGRRRFFARRALERAKKKDFPITEADLEAIRNLHELSSDPGNCAHFLSHFNLIATLLDSRKLPWIFTHIDWDPVTREIQPLLTDGYLPTSRYLGTPFEKIDRSDYDAAHPGPESHQKFAEHMCGSVTSNRLIEQAAARRARGEPGSAMAQVKKPMLLRLGRLFGMSPRREAGHKKDKENIYPQW